MQPANYLYFLKRLLIALPIIAVFFQWATDFVLSNNLLYEVDNSTDYPFFETQYLYFYLVVGTAISSFCGTLTLRKVRYWEQWKYLFPAIGIVGVFFIIWDVLFTIKGVWGFNAAYHLPYTIFHLPLEEWAFFVAIPFACIAIYECLNTAFGQAKKSKLSTLLDNYGTPILIVHFLGIGIWKWGHIYTSSTFLLAGSCLLFHFLFVQPTYRLRFYTTYLISWLPFILVNGILTGGYTEQPVVVYNPAEYFGIRIFSTIPIDDSIYNFLLLLMNITLFEYFRGTDLLTSFEN